MTFSPLWFLCVSISFKFRYIITIISFFFSGKDIPPKAFAEQLCAKGSVCNGVYGEKSEYGDKKGYVFGSL